MSKEVRTPDNSLVVAFIKGGDEVIHKELGDSMKVVIYCFSSRRWQDSGNINRTQSMGRKISDIDIVPTISLVQPQQDMEYDFDATTSIPVTTAGLEISTADAAVTTTSASISTVSPLEVSTAKDISGAETLILGSNSIPLPMDSEKGKQRSEKEIEGRLKRVGQDVIEEPAKRQKTTKASESVQEQPSEEPKADELSQEQLQQMMLLI
ncbi:hypothetical protein Tco_0641590 [Tanacetum coccineum]